MLSDADWSEAASSVLHELAESLGLGPMTAGEGAPSSGGVGMIALAGQSSSQQLVLIASEASCTALAKRMLMFEDDEPIDRADVADAICEILNIYAGMLKTALHDRITGLHLGLPAFVWGQLETRPGTAKTRVEVSLGGEPVTLVVERIESKADVDGCVEERAAAVS